MRDVSTPAVISLLYTRFNDSAIPSILRGRDEPQITFRVVQAISVAVIYGLAMLCTHNESMQVQAPRPLCFFVPSVCHHVPDGTPTFRFIPTPPPPSIGPYKREILSVYPSVPAIAKRDKCMGNLRGQRISLLKMVLYASKPACLAQGSFMRLLIMNSSVTLIPCGW